MEDAFDYMVMEDDVDLELGPWFQKSIGGHVALPLWMELRPVSHVSKRKDG